jgi:hypothetical protein
MMLAYSRKLEERDTRAIRRVWERKGWEAA